MKLIILISALIVSAIPAKAQQEKYTPKEQSIFYAGTIFGAGVIYCKLLADGKVSDKERQEHMLSILNTYKNETAAKDYGELIDRIYDDAMVCH